MFALFFFFTVFSRASELQTLLREEDTDHDKKITVLDRGDRIFRHQGTTIKGHYRLSNLLQELTLAAEDPSYTVELEKIHEDPVERISRMIREHFWKGLTRSIDEESLPQVLPDAKVDTGGVSYLYIPESDRKQFERFSKRASQKIRVEKLRGTVPRHGLLFLPEPYVVPGGRFNEMYGWDSYFESVGLMIDGEKKIVEGMVKNFSYQILNYGKILNANRTYYLHRSQPPFFTTMIRLLLNGREKPEWLRTAVSAAILEYESVWTGPERLTGTGLSRYHGKGRGVPPEVEPGHFHPIFRPYADRLKLTPSQYQEKYESGKVREPELDLFFEHDACVRESGHDTTYRFRFEGKDACADFVTVDLNALLLKTELDLAWLIQHYFGGNFDGKSATSFLEKAQRRKDLILKYLRDPNTGYFFDYHVPSGKRSTYISATGLYPLMIGERKVLSRKDADKAIDFALKHLEGPGGLYATAKVSRESVSDPHERQWDFPYGWAPHQMIAWEALFTYDRRKDAERLITKWLRMIAENARDYNGTVPEKFDVLRRSHAVFAEYGNVGTEFSYVTREGFGWMNASFQFGLSLLSPKAKEALKRDVR